MNVKAFKYQAGIWRVATASFHGQKQHFEVSREHHLAAAQDLLQALQPHRS
jgi:hypothetical protein